MNTYAPSKEESRILHYTNKGVSLSEARMNAAEELAARGYNPEQYGLATKEMLEALNAKLQSATALETLKKIHIK